MACMIISTIVMLWLSLAAMVANGSPTVDSEVDWILQRQVPASGAFLLAQQGSWVNPYSANIALTNVLRVRTTVAVTSAVKRWITWYISKLVYPKPGVATISEWDSYPDGREVSRNYADSTDSFATTFLSLVRRYYDASGDRSFVISLVPKLKEIAEGALLTMDFNLNLTYAKPDYPEYYLMDNLEVWKGFSDFASLLSDLNEPDPSYYWGNRAEQIRYGIEKNLYDKVLGYYHSFYRTDGSNGIDWSTLNAGTLANIYTQVYNIPEALEPTRRSRIYQLWSAGPKARWIERNFTEGVDGTDFPLAYASEATRLNGDIVSLNKWKSNVLRLWFPKRDYTWNIDDASYLVVRLAEN